VVSPDGKTLLILTSGYQRYYTNNIAPLPPSFPWYDAYSNEYVFIYDISTPTLVKKQVVQVPNTYNGIVFDPSGSAFYVAGGKDDNVHIFTLGAAGVWAEDSKSPLALGHQVGVGLDLKPTGAIQINSQVGVFPCTAGVAISSDGKTLVVANYYNDSITVFRGGLGKWAMVPGPNPNILGLDLRPGKSAPAKSGIPGGEYPFGVAMKGNGSNAIAYVSSIRDREIVVVSLGDAPAVTSRIPVKGQPNKMTLNKAQSLLYVVEDQSDTVDVIDTGTNGIIETIAVISNLSVLPSSLARYTGANPNSATLSPDEKILYVTNGNLNCISVVALSGTNNGDRVVGLIPTGWYPNSLSFSGDGSRVYVVNAKSPTGPNAGWCYGGYGPAGWPTCSVSNQYNPQQTKAGLQTFPLPGVEQLKTLTAQVAANNRFSYTQSPSDSAVMAAVRQGIKHVIFIIKENRTYDQILGDLEIGNGDPDLTEFGRDITPNQHSLARKFVTLDNFLDTAEVSYDGWLWSTAAKSPDVVERQYQVAYAYRGVSLDSEGTNRNVNVALPYEERIKANPFTSKDPDVLPGSADTAAPDGPNNEVNTGYLWDAAFRAGLTVRNYGFFVDTTLYSTKDFTIPLVRDPFASGTIVGYPTNVALAPYTDPYFRGFDNAFPDYFRFREWERDFNARYVSGHRAGPSAQDLPALTLVRFMHDHNGGDHVDAHRSTAYVVGP
jgi:YVTN family beta-propeller protein